MSTAKLFMHGRSQAVRLPKEFRFEGTEVFVRRAGNDVILSARTPPSADALIGALTAFEPGITLTREQPAFDARDDIAPHEAASKP
jgi:antitoxin VapB